MTAPMLPQKRPTLSRKEARAHFNDAQIADYLKANPDVELVEDDGPAAPTLKRPQIQTAPRESTTTPATHGEDVRGLANDWPALAREVGRGATFGLSDKIEAGARALGDETYEGVRNEQRAERKGFQERNPVIAPVANAMGAMAGGAGIARLGARMAPGLVGGTVRALGGNVPVGSGVTTLSRIGSGIAAGAVQGGAAALLSADGSVKDRAIAGGVGAGIGGAAGGVFAGAAELLRGGKKVVQGGRDMYRARQGESIPIDNDQAARETLPILARAGKTPDQLRAATATADDADIMAEIVGQRGVRSLGSAHRYGLQPEPIAKTLDARAMDEGANFANKLETLTGAKIRDAKSVADEAMTAVKPTVDAKWASAAPKQVPRESLEPLVDDLDKLRRDGVDVWRPARAADETFPESMAPFRSKTDEPPPVSQILDASGTPFAKESGPKPSMTVGELRRVRESLDAAIDYGDLPHADSQTKAAQARLKALRYDVDKIVKQFGGEDAQQADALFSGAKAKGESFAQGERLRSGADPTSATEEGLTNAVKNARDPEALRQGAASNLQNSVRTANDGTGGSIGNPVKAGFGSPKVKARSAIAFDDPAKFKEAEKAAENVTNRMRTRGQVLHGSQTAERLADDIQEIAPGFLESLAKGNVFGAGGAALKFANQGARGASLDRKARILLAGGPGQMSKDDANDLLAAAYKFVLRDGAKQSNRAAMAGRVAAGEATRPR